ncbi:hypothetical protein TNCV_2803721 [Trichonephila clavipes]|nr:hypothetical protein TNCV_2803721 [Trichonephila clavipes]
MPQEKNLFAGCPPLVKSIRKTSSFLCLNGRGSLVITETDSWPACHKFEPSTNEDPPCTGVMHVKSLETHKHPPFGVEVRRGGARAPVLSSLFDRGSGLRHPSSKTLE